MLGGVHGKGKWCNGVVPGVYMLKWYAVALVRSIFLVGFSPTLGVLANDRMSFLVLT